MKIGDTVQLTSATIPVSLEVANGELIPTGEGFITGKIINKIVYHLVIECNDGTIVEGDEADLSAGRLLKVL